MCASRFKKCCVVLGVVAIVLGAVYFFFLSPRYAVPILMYHDFAPLEQKGNPLLVTTQSFERQMAYLKEHGYHVIPLDQLVDGIKEKKRFPHKTVVLTFDDGYRSNYEYVYPVLRKYGFSAIIFLPAHLIEMNARFLTWAQIREMSGQGISFGSHTKEHLVLSHLTDTKQLWDEIAGSKPMIEKQAGVPVRFFSYPVGAFTDEVVRYVKEAGYKGAVTTKRGQGALYGADPYLLRRISVRDDDLSWKFWAKVSGYYNVFRKTYHVQ